jgi:uncharacterized phage-associated protein
MKPPDPNAWKELVENKDKIQEAILYLLTLRAPLTQYQIVKALWFADSSHLTEYGRPVTFDNYVAMQQGPVPSLAYDALKPDFAFDKVFGNGRPWRFSRHHRREDVRNIYKKREPRLEYLSETDKEALKAGLKRVESTSAEQLERIVHRHPAWRKAWNSKRVGAEWEPMELSLIIGEGGDELAKQLAYLTEDA